MWGSPEPSWRGLAPSIVPVWPTYAAAQTDEAVQLSQSRLGVGSRDRKKGGGRRGLEGGLFICVALVNTPMCNERSHCVEGLWNKVACRVKDKLSLKIYVNNPKTVRKTQKDEKCQSWRNTFSWSDFLSINHLTDILSFANRSFRVWALEAWNLKSVLLQKNPYVTPHFWDNKLLSRYFLPETSRASCGCEVTDSEQSVTQCSADMKTLCSAHRNNDKTETLTEPISCHVFSDGLFTLGDFQDCWGCVFFFNSG